MSSHLKFKDILRKPFNRSPSPHPLSPSEDDDMNSDRPVTLAVIGCGQRGKGYAKYALSNPEQCKVVAMAEPRPQTRKLFASAHHIDHSLVFSTWQELHAASAETLATVGKRLADAVIVAVQDQMHAEVVIAFAKQGYHILCEKPMSTNPEELIQMEEVVDEAGVIFGMGHVLRYSPYTQEISEIVRSGQLGELINVVHVEPVGYYHFSHSYVRGSWRKEESSSFSLMSKSCHDIDILCYWLFPAKPKRVTSFGSLRHFRKESKPKEAGNATRCLDCPLQSSCAYSARKIYLDPLINDGHKSWPVSTIVDGVPDIENVTQALKTTSYGQCVYESDNDVADHQVVNIEFSNGSTCSFTMVAFTSLICERQTRMHFTHGEIVGDMNRFTVNDFRKGYKIGGASTLHKPINEGGGHGGGDLGLIRTFVKAVREKRQGVLGTDVKEVVRSHLTVFAAEKSRKDSGAVVDCEDFEREVRERARLNGVRRVADKTGNGHIS